jgi:glycosyltransferase involved in cell wall biosynthesis
MTGELQSFRDSSGFTGAWSGPRKVVRVLVVTNMYPPHHYGGYELSCQDTVRRFTAAGHQVAILTSDIRVPGVAETDAGPESVSRDLRMYWDDHKLLSPPLARRLSIERSNQRALSQAISRARPDVVSIWNMGALSLGLLTTILRNELRVVYVIGDDWPVYAQLLDAWSRLYRRPAGRLLAPVVHLLTRVPTAIADFTRFGPCLFNSQTMQEVVREKSGLSLPRSEVVQPGLDTVDFPLVPVGGPVAPRPWRGRLLYVGRIDERKGTDTAVRALSLLPESRLRIVGRGDEAFGARLRAIASECGVSDRIEFATIPRSQLAAEYRAADALLFTSVYREPFGIVPLEAMACDTPVIATGTGGSGEYLVDGSNSLLYRPQDHSGLAAMVRRLADDRELRLRLVKGGRDTARRLTADAYAESLLSWHLSAAAAG